MEDQASKTLPPGVLDARLEAYKKFVEQRIAPAKSEPVAANATSFEDTPTPAPTPSPTPSPEVVPIVQVTAAPKVLRPEVRASLPYLDRDDDELVRNEAGEWVKKDEE